MVSVVHSLLPRVQLFLVTHNTRDRLAQAASRWLLRVGVPAADILESQTG